MGMNQNAWGEDRSKGHVKAFHQGTGQFGRQQEEEVRELKLGTLMAAYEDRGVRSISQGTKWVRLLMTTELPD